MSKIYKTFYSQEVLKLFESKVSRPNAYDCWEWLAYKLKAGYGCFNGLGVKSLAHRLAFQLYKGRIPEGLVVIHACDNPSCVNPSHLSLGTPKDNMDDMWNKGRGVVGKRYSGNENISRRKPELLTHGSEHWKAKLTEDDVRYIMENFKRRDKEFGTKGLAAKLGVTQAAVSKVVRGINWNHVTGLKRRWV